jgi:hypothetical protein
LCFVLLPAVSLAKDYVEDGNKQLEEVCFFCCGNWQAVPQHFTRFLGARVPEEQV